MDIEVSPSDPRDQFRRLLNEAITAGTAPSAGTDLGPYTLVAITVIAAEHPDASPDSIASAYDAFLSEEVQHRRQ